MKAWVMGAGEVEARCRGVLVEGVWQDLSTISLSVPSSGKRALAALRALVTRGEAEERRGYGGVREWRSTPSSSSRRP